MLRLLCLNGRLFNVHYQRCNLMWPHKSPKALFECVRTLKTGLCQPFRSRGLEVGQGGTALV